MERLFSYGTLQEEEVQKELFGRTLNGRFDKLPGYRKDPIRLSSEFHSPDEQYWIAVAADDDDGIDGMMLEVTSDELAQADSYEPPEYKRALVTLASGNQAWAYVAAGE